MSTMREQYIIMEKNHREVNELNNTHVDRFVILVSMFSIRNDLERFADRFDRTYQSIE